LVLVGASLGGAIALDFAAAYPAEVSKLLLIDAQGFIDGAGPMGGFPEPIARLGVKVLGAKGLRQVANKLSYFDKVRFATEDAMLVGRLPVLCEGWEDSNLNYMSTGGFTPSVLVPKVACPTLVLWGANDEILDPKLYAQRFVDEMPNARLTMIPECGHVPHLEKPEVAAKAIADFIA
jgi:pimeloyl-ACP methyl ester carboxylesterase